jgi:HAD superfamily hydrolase (TIGR01509 family)
MRIKAFIFDMDGVMLDSEPYQLMSFNKVLGRFGVSVLMPEFKKKYMGSRDTQICERMIADYKLPITAEAFVNGKRSAYLEVIVEENVPPTEGLVDAIGALSAVLPLGIASSSQVNEIELITRKFGVRDRFQIVLSSHQVPNGKPAPDVYLKASEMIGVEPALCGVIEDTPTGIRSAKAAGMACVGITTTHTAEELGEADAVIGSFGELFQAVQNL